MYKNIQLNQKNELIEIPPDPHPRETTESQQRSGARGFARTPPQGGQGGGPWWRYRAGVPRQRARAGRQRAGAPASASGSGWRSPGRCSAPTSARREAASGSASERERFGVEVTGQVSRANERAPGGSERERQRARAVRGGGHRAGIERQRARAVRSFAIV